MKLSARAPGGIPPAGFVHYVYGAALGCPPRGRPEKVLAPLKFTTSMKQEDRVARDVRGAVPGVRSRNGMPDPQPYVYRGTGKDTLTAGLSPWRLAVEANAAMRGASPPRPPARRKPAPKRVPRPEVPGPAAAPSGPVPAVPAAAEPAPEPRKPHRKPVLTTACPGCGRLKPDKYVTCGGTGPCLAPRPAPEPEPEPEPVPVPAPVPLPEPEPAAVAAPVPAKRCRKCTYPIGSVGHRTVCGDGK